MAEITRIRMKTTEFGRVQMPYGPKQYWNQGETYAVPDPVPLRVALRWIDLGIAEDASAAAPAPAPPPKPAVEDRAVPRSAFKTTDEE